MQRHLTKEIRRKPKSNLNSRCWCGLSPFFFVPARIKGWLRVGFGAVAFTISLRDRNDFPLTSAQSLNSHINIRPKKLFRRKTKRALDSQLNRTVSLFAKHQQFADEQFPNQSLEILVICHEAFSHEMKTMDSPKNLPISLILKPKP